MGHNRSLSHHVWLDTKRRKESKKMKAEFLDSADASKANTGYRETPQQILQKFCIKNGINKYIFPWNSRSLKSGLGISNIPFLLFLLKNNLNLSFWQICPSWFYSFSSTFSNFDFPNWNFEARNSSLKHPKSSIRQQTSIPSVVTFSICFSGEMSLWINFIWALRN